MKNNWFEGLRTLAEIKAEYKKLVKVHHPDVGGDTATMQEINAQYAEAVEWIARHGEGRDRQDAAAEVPEEYAAAVAAVVNLGGVTVELVGSWIWVTGNTYIYKDAIKAAGYRWASKKRAWYWHPADAGCHRGGKKSLAEIREKYGCERIRAGVAYSIA